MADNDKTRAAPRATVKQMEDRLALARLILKDFAINGATKIVLLDILSGVISPGYERAHDALYGDEGWKRLGLQPGDPQSPAGGGVPQFMRGEPTS